MRSIEYLIQLYPDKKGSEILKIQEKDKAEDEKKFRKINMNKLKIIEDINNNGGFWKGRFGYEQHFYYSFTNLRLENSEIYCDVEHLVAFNNERMSIEFKQETWKKFENYGTSIYERTTKEDFEKAISYYKKSFDILWESIKTT